MSSEPLTLAEAVPLGTVHLQRLLERAGVRCLVIKGPAFAELGVRRPRVSHDIDLLIHQDDRTTATAALAASGWSIISYWFPPAMDDIIYSTTFRTALFPVTLDLHHRFSGLLAGAAAFDVLWEQRTHVEVGHQLVCTVSREDSLIIEALNATKKLSHGDRLTACERVVAVADAVDLDRVLVAAERLGARHTAAPLIRALGGPDPQNGPPPGYKRWVDRGARTGGVELFVDLMRRAPSHIPRVLWQQLTLSPDSARFWADAHGVSYTGRWQILWLRARRVVER